MYIPPDIAAYRVKP